MKKNVLLLETIAGEADRILRENTEVIDAFNVENPVDVTGDHDIHAIVTRGKGQVNRKLMDSCPDLAAIARCGVGLDNVDLQEAASRKIKVIHAPGSNSATIAEHTLALMLMLLRNIYHSVERVKAGQWNWRNRYKGDELSGKTLGILGMGNIGQRVARLADAFGMEIIYWDKYPVQSPFTSLPFHEVLQKADVVTLHVPLLKETENMIGADEIGLMQPHACLINTARGGLIDQGALTKALDSESIAGFAADVLAEEPPGENEPLPVHPKSLITPHTGSLTTTTYRNMCLSTVKNLISVLNNRKPDPNSVFNQKQD